MTWPYRRVRLWHPDSPGVRMKVSVLWPRYLFHLQFATLGEVLREYRLRKDAEDV